MLPTYCVSDSKSETGFKYREVIMTPRAGIMRFGSIVLSVAACAVIGASFSDDVWSQMARLAARDPGVRPGPVATDLKLPGLTPSEQRAFDVGLEAFQEVASVKGTIPETEAR